VRVNVESLRGDYVLEAHLLEELPENRECSLATRRRLRCVQQARENVALNQKQTGGQYGSPEQTRTNTYFGAEGAGWFDHLSRWIQLPENRNPESWPGRYQHL